MRLESFKQLGINRVLEILDDDLNVIFLKARRVHIFNPVLSRQISIGLDGFAYIDKPVRGIFSQFEL